MSSKRQSSIVLCCLVLLGCATTADHADRADRAEIDTVEQAVGDACTTSCRTQNLLCMRDCAQDPMGGDCGCAEQYIACKAACPTATATAFQTAPTITTPTPTSAMVMAPASTMPATR